MVFLETLYVVLPITYAFIILTAFENCRPAIDPYATPLRELPEYPPPSFRQRQQQQQQQEQQQASSKQNKFKQQQEQETN
jgi:hypothetical protein